jgi:hypothetical protein
MMSLSTVRAAVGTDLQLRAVDLARQRLDVRLRPRSRPRQPDVRRVDPQLIHVMQQPQLVFNRRILHRWGLQAVPQRLVVQQHVGRPRRLADLVPVVDQFVFVIHRCHRVLPQSSKYTPRIRAQVIRCTSMCRNIRKLRRAESDPAEAELRDAALQYVRKISGYREPSARNREAFQRAVEAVTQAGRSLFRDLSGAASSKDAQDP